MPRHYSFTGNIKVWPTGLLIDHSKPIELKSPEWEIRGHVAPSKDGITSTMLVKGTAIVISNPEGEHAKRAPAQHHLGAYYEVDLTSTPPDQRAEIASNLLSKLEPRNTHSRPGGGLVFAKGKVTYYSPKECVKMDMWGTFFLLPQELGCHYVMLKGEFERRETHFVTDDLIHHHPTADLGVVEWAKGLFDLTSGSDFNPVLVNGELRSGNRKIAVDLVRTTPPSMALAAAMGQINAAQGASRIVVGQWKRASARDCKHQAT